MLNLITSSIIFYWRFPLLCARSTVVWEVWGSLGAAKVTVIRKATQPVIKAHSYQQEMWRSAQLQILCRYFSWYHRNMSKASWIITSGHVCLFFLIFSAVKIGESTLGRCSRTWSQNQSLTFYMTFRNSSTKFGYISDLFVVAAGCLRYCRHRASLPSAPGALSWGDPGQPPVALPLKAP